MAKDKSEQWLTDDGLIQLEEWARDGLTDEQIATNMGVSVSCLYRYKNKHDKICNALKKGKAVVDFQVENALFKRAMGYRTTEITKELVDNVLTVTKEVDKEVQPDTTAQIFWLKNRKPAEWRDRKDLDMNAKINNPFQGLTKEQLVKLASEESE